MDRAEEILVAAGEALDRCKGVDVVYLHDAEGAMFGAIVRAGTPAWEKLNEGEEMLSHDHIETGMF